MGEAIKQRVRLWLRSERAMGLGSAPVAIRPIPQPVFRDAPVSRAAPGSRAAQPGAVHPAQRQQVDPTGRNPAPQSPPPHPARSTQHSALSPQPSSLPIIRFDQPITGPALSREEKIRQLDAMQRAEVERCTACRLHEGRTQIVFGEGDVDADLFFAGEAPGAQEDRTGRPFVGDAGAKLTEMIRAMGLTRERVYIANTIKCRPPDNRVPAPDEVAHCGPFLARQLEIIRPRVIVALGLVATQYLLQTKQGLGQLRGRWASWRGIKVMPTYHPSYILRTYTPQVRKTVWSDLQMVMAELGLERPASPPRQAQ